MLTKKQRNALLHQLVVLREKTRAAESRVAARDVAHGIERLCSDIESCMEAVRATFYTDSLRIVQSAIQDILSADMPKEERRQGFSLLDDVYENFICQMRQEKVKKIFLFLPYQASMWDSLESVYIAAAADCEHTEAYVMPIPYCDRNPDGLARKWYDERERFPDMIPILDYRDVDLATMHPDVIFIHNPYDGNNLITSVHPDFYSDRLKKHCKTLVYIPYFVSETSLDSHFVNFPAIYNADYVIVESEEIRRQYIAYYDGQDKSRLTDKVLALGSPKYDAVRNKKKQENNLPKAWDRICTGRKVVLYCTSIKDVLKNTSFHGEKGKAVINKMKEVFDFFRDNEEYSLWWRPHPLIKKTLYVMCPWVLPAYEALERTYCEEGWGIFDDTSDVERAVVCTDIYYGDMSSVAHLYQLQKRPMVYQDYEQTPPFAPYWVLDFIEDEDEKTLWLLPPATHRLLEMDRKSGKLLDVHVLEKDFCTYEIWDRCVMETVGDLLFIAPFATRDFIFFDKKTKSVTRMPLIHEGEAFLQPRIYGAVRYGASVYFYGRYPAIVEIDIESGLVHLHGQENGCYRSLVCSGFYHYNQHVILQENLYFVLAINHIVVSFSLTDKTISFHSIGQEGDVYTLVTVDDDGTIWMYSSTGALCHWILETGGVERIQLPNLAGIWEPIGIGVTGKKIILYPSDSYQDMLFYNKETGAVEVYPAATEGYGGYNAVKRRRDGCTVAYSAQRNEMHVYDASGRLSETLAISIPKEAVEVWEKAFAGQNGRPILERTMLPLEKVLERVQGARLENVGQSEGDEEDIGERIYNYIAKGSV